MNMYVARALVFRITYIKRPLVNLNALESRKSPVCRIGLDECDLDDSLGNAGRWGAVLALDLLNVANKALLVEADEILLSGREMGQQSNWRDPQREVDKSMAVIGELFVGFS